MREFIPDSRSIKGKAMIKMFDRLKDLWAERRNSKVLTIWVTTPGTIGTTTGRQVRLKVGRGATM